MCGHMGNTIIPDVLYHYTRLENLQNIIRTGNDGGELVFWLTHFRQMDDPSEGKILEDTVKEIVPEFNLHNIPDAYILSMCGNVDNLPMWREYADNAQGIAIALDRQMIECNTKDVRRAIQKCEYDKGKTLNAIKERLRETNIKFEDGSWIEGEYRVTNFDKFPELKGRPENISILRYLDVRKFFNELVTFKDCHYYYENEYRLPIIYGYYAERQKIRVNKKRVIDFREYHIDIRALKGVYVGPNNKNAEEVVHYIGRHINSLNLPQQVDVEIVDLPYKTNFYNYE